MNLETRLLYAVVMLSSIVAALTLLRGRQEKLALNYKQRAAVAIAAFSGAMLGAKLPFLLERDWRGIVSPALWLSDGKTILGGIFGGYLAVEVTKRCMAIQIRTGDSFALPIAVAVAIGRFGCFVAGCCFGCVTDLPWGITFAVAHDPPGTLRHPTQIYECVFHLLCAGWLVIAERNQWFRGNRLKIYLLAYLAYRFVSEWLRPEPSTPLGFTAYQLACVVLGGILIVLWVSERPVPDSGVAK